MVSHYFLQKVSKKLCSGLCNYQCYLSITHAFELRNVLLVFIRITYDFIHDDSYTEAGCSGKLMGFPSQIHVRLN